MIPAALLGILAVAGAAAAAPPSAAARPNVLLVTVDTLRADRVGAYGYAKGATATMDRLAREGVLVEDAVVHVPQTRPSHASIFTGRLPYEHGIRDNYSRPLPESIPTLASLLRRAGWDTGAFIGAYPVSRPSGLDQGFNVYGDPFEGGDATAREARTERRGKEVVDAALEWLRKPRDRPFLAWVHLFDPHAPYEAPPPFGPRFAESPYDGEVAYADAQIGRLLDWLDRGGERGRTLVVVTADHGEGLGEHGEDEHMFFVYDSTLKVPLVLSWPGRLPAGARVAGQFRAIDLMPTLLDLAGVKAPPVTGVSRAAALVPGGRIRESESYAESLYAQLHFGYAPLRALRGDGWKLIEAPRPELYRVAEDPGETRNRLDDRAGIASAMRTRLAGYDREQGRAPELPALDPDAAARLAALGYVGGAAGPSAARTSGIDPKDKIGEVQEHQRAMRVSIERFQKGDYAAAARALERAARTGPPSFNVEYYLGRSLFELRRFADAIPHLEKAAEMAPTRHTLSGLAAAPIYARLVDAYAAAGQSQRAFATLDKALQVAPANAELLRARGSLLLRQGDLAAARAALEKARATDAREPRLHVELANCYRNLGDLPNAEAAASAALRLDARSADAQLAFGLVMGAVGRDAEAARALREAVRLSPEHPDALFYLAAIELRAGRAGAALPLLEKVQRLAPDYPRLREALAMAGKTARAPAATP